MQIPPGGPADAFDTRTCKAPKSAGVYVTVTHDSEEQAGRSQLSLNSAGGRIAADSSVSRVVPCLGTVSFVMVVFQRPRAAALSRAGLPRLCIVYYPAPPARDSDEIALVRCSN